MALTRKYLAALGIEAEKIDEIIQAHAETVEALKNERDQAKAEAAKLPDVQGELDTLKESIKSGYVSKTDHDKTVAEFDAYKATVANEKALAAKEKAARAYYEAKGIKGADLSIAMRGSSTEIAALKLKADGTIEDAATLDALVQGDFSRLVGASETRQVDTGGPMAAGGNVKPSANEYMNSLIRGKGV